MKKLLPVFLLFLAACNPLADREGVTVIGVKDGDTVEVLTGDSATQVIRLADIDCPEKSQPFGKAAKQFTSDLCYGKHIKLVSTGESGGWGRVLGTIYVDDTICVNKELVKAGLAWHFKRYSNSYEYEKLETQARKQNLGLWADGQAIPPWDWRKGK